MFVDAMLMRLLEVPSDNAAVDGNVLAGAKPDTACSANNVPAAALYQGDNVFTDATSAARVTAAEEVGMTEVANAPSSSWGRPMRTVMSMAWPDAAVVLK